MGANGDYIGSAAGVLAAMTVCGAYCMTKIKELAGGCLLAACVATLGAAFIGREAWRLLRPGGPRPVDPPADEPEVQASGQAQLLMTRFH